MPEELEVPQSYRTFLELLVSLRQFKHSRLLEPKKGISYWHLANSRGFNHLINVAYLNID